MIAQQKRIESIAANLANANTAGFKRRLTTTHGNMVGRPGAQQVGIVVKSANDFAQGSLQRTGQELDMAFQGPGFFTVEGPEGEIFTRDGEFHLNGEGILVTPEGYPVANVTEFSFDNKRPFAQIKARPTVQFDRLRYLLLVWPTPSEYQLEEELTRGE